jgi:hypothetical protein
MPTAAAADVLETLPSPLADGSLLTRLAGVVVVAGLPAVLWPLMLNFAASAAGLSLTPPLLVAFALAVATFLAAVCAPLMLRDAR